ncbi:MAG: TIGR00269 family protein [Candidatus Marsarchaeota archaeon]|nr:TIGR00269 family protein [Candidatus Marsarchaeota archaeon]
MKNENMLSSGDTVLIGLSGGKDSVVLTDILGRLARKMRDLNLVAATVDEGISTGESSYREEALGYAREVAAKFNVPLHVYSYRELFGGTLDSYVRLRVQNGSACSVCGVFRRRALNEAARRLGANKIALGHNKDDEAQTVLMNVLRGDLERMLRTAEGTHELVRRIKPLRRLSEREVAIYAYLRGYGFQSVECPYSRDTVRDKVREVLFELEGHVSGSRDALLNFEDKLRDVARAGGLYAKCELCGEPTSSSRKLCKVCEYIQEFRRLSGLNPEPV